MASKIIDNSPSFKNVKVEPDGDDRFKVTGSFISSEFTVTKRAFTCDAWMDGSQVAARAIIGKVEETYS
ncbi:hypothetical protein ACN95_14640 [Gordonia sihwensis]|nr:hypothetical protein [Gordonia sihwensis]